MQFPKIYGLGVWSGARGGQVGGEGEGVHLWFDDLIQKLHWIWITL
jgi:hypothetical protein